MHRFYLNWPGCRLGSILLHCPSNNGWRTASRVTAKIAPDPASVHEAILHVYGADTWRWRGWFAIHTWISKQVPELELKLPFSALDSGYVN